MREPDFASFEYKTITSSLMLDSRRVESRKGRVTPHVMVIDDDIITQRLAANILSKNCFLLHCDNPSDAINDYLRFMPDLVFIDINLGDAVYHGIDVLYNILKHDPEAYAVMLSAHECADNMQLAGFAGAKSFVSKPFTDRILMHHLHACEFTKLSKDLP